VVVVDVGVEGVEHETLREESLPFRSMEQVPPPSFGGEPVLFVFLESRHPLLGAIDRTAKALVVFGGELHTSSL
jgi:hypothetical protein